ncbi:MAG: copper amine oxidase N-terminal domain-containing protein [Oscillospiraceae bacterium]|nr:copper amine oxidase N-terminal domain-containing protein [Oscillospiraceae bacterium]
MKKTLCRILSLALCAALACALPAFAAETEAPVSGASAHMAPVRVWGAVTRLESGSLLLQNSDESDPNREIVVHIAQTTPVVDAVSGLPVELSTIKDGDTVCAWVGPAMTMSLPPQASASAVVANIPADGAAPQYYEITGPDQTVTIAIYPPPPRTAVHLPAAGGEVLTIPVSAQVSPWLTKQIVTLDDLTPGSRILAWRDTDGGISRVLLLPNTFRGYLLAWAGADSVFLNGERLSVSGKASDGQVLLPIRAVAEAAGYQVDWVAGKGAVVSDGGETVFSVLPGSKTARTADEERGLTGPCVFESGVTYLPAGDLASLLNLFFSPGA